MAALLRLGNIVCVDGNDDYCGRIVAVHPLSKPPSYDVKLDSDNDESESTFSYLPQSRLKAYSSKWGGRRKSLKGHKGRTTRKNRKTRKSRR